MNKYQLYLVKTIYSGNSWRIFTSGGSAWRTIIVFVNDFTLTSEGIIRISKSLGTLKVEGVNDKQISIPYGTTHMLLGDERTNVHTQEYTEIHKLINVSSIRFTSYALTPGTSLQPGKSDSTPEPSGSKIETYGVRIKPNQPPTTPSTVTLPSTIQGGQSCRILWSASTDPDGNLEGYKVERSYDGGSSWVQIYQGSSTQTTHTVPFGTKTVMFRVKAYDTQGAESGWRTSSNKTVVNNRAPSAPPSIAVPLTPQGGQPLTITWTASTDADNNLAGYALERQWDGAGSFTQIYQGNALSYQDTIPKAEHTSVTYRVRAYDTQNAFSGYTTSPNRVIENNTPPVIASSLSGDLGLKTDGFVIPYTVTDAEQQAVTVVEQVGDLIKRTYQPTLGQSNNFEITDAYFQQILNGVQTVKITATDANGMSSSLILTFTKKVTAASVTLEAPIPSTEQIKVAVLSITGNLPADTVLSVQMTNNGADEVPVWEDATQDVRLGRNHVFENQTQTQGWAFNFKVRAERGEHDLAGSIQSIQGGFQ